MLSTVFSIQVAREIFYGISLQAFYNFYESHNILLFTECSNLTCNRFCCYSYVAVFVSDDVC